jgi:hypothetical protein
VPKVAVPKVAVPKVAVPKVATQLRQSPELKSMLKTEWPPQQGVVLAVSPKMGELVERVPE